MPTDPTTGLTTPDPTTTSSSGGFDPTSLISAALRLYQGYQSTQPGTFQQIPESPLQTAARAQLLGYTQSSPTRDLLGNLIGQRLAAVRPFQLPQGAGGYNPNPTGGAPSYDLSKILPMLTGSGGSAPPSATPSSTAPGPTIGPPTGGQGTGGVFAPAGSPGDPLGSLPIGGGPGGAPGADSDPISSWLSSHPNVLRMGVDVAAGAVASIFGIPPATAAKAVDSFMQTFRGTPAPKLPVDPSTVKPWDLTPAGSNPSLPGDPRLPPGAMTFAPPPRTNLNPPGLTDPWTAPFMQNGNEGGYGLRPPQGFDPYAPGKPLP